MRIFVIDHSQADSALAALVLGKSLPKAEIVRLTRESLREAAPPAPDVVVVDPSSADAPDLTARVRARFPQTPLVVFAAEMSEERQLAVIESDPEEWLTKNSVGYLRLAQCVRRAAERSARPADEAGTFDALLERTRRGYFEADAQGRVLKANATLAGFLQASHPGELVGRQLPHLFYRSTDRSTLFERIREHGVTHTHDWPATDEGDDGPFLEVTETVARRPSGEIVIEGLVEDISRHRRQSEELSRSNRDLRDFAYTASHELQAPLRMVERYTDILAKDHADSLDEEGKEYLQFARDGAGRMQALVDELLEFSRVDSRGRPGESCEATDSVEAAVANLRPLIQDSGAEVSYNGLPRVQADPVQLTMVFQNLISNAIKFRGEAPPRIDVSGQARNGEHVFTVADNGIGISRDDLPNIFTLFKRLHPEIPGTGIGLALCDRIVRRQGGRIWAESDSGQGSTFFFTLPVTHGL